MRFYDNVTYKYNSFTIAVYSVPPFIDMVSTMLNQSERVHTFKEHPENSELRSQQLNAIFRVGDGRQKRIR